MALFGLRFVFVCILISMVEPYMAEAASQTSNRLRRWTTKMDLVLETVFEIKHSLHDLRENVSLLQQQNTTTCDPVECDSSQQAGLYDRSERPGSIETVIEDLESTMTTVLKGFREEKAEVRKMLEDHEKYVDSFKRERDEIKNEFDAKCETNSNEAIEKITHANETFYKYFSNMLEEHKLDLDDVKRELDGMKNFDKEHESNLDVAMDKVIYTYDTLNENVAEIAERQDRLSKDLDKVKSEVSKCLQEIPDIENRMLIKMWRSMSKNIKVYGKSLYIFHSEKMTWTQSQQKCQEEKFHLAEINDEDEHAVVRHMTGSQQAWLGATDIDNEGTWQWLTSGIDVPASIWRINQPDNYRDREHCLQMGAIGFNDLECGTKLMSVCELEL